MTRYRTTASKAPPAAMARIVFMRTGTLAAVGGRNNDLPKGRKRVLRRVHASTGSLRSYESTRRACLRADPYSGGPAGNPLRVEGLQGDHSRSSRRDRKSTRLNSSH